MIALEVEARIVNHRIEIDSDRLPQNAARAKVIVLYEEDTATDHPKQEESDPIALARAARASFPKVDRKVLEADFAALRDEWERGF
jgi:hypothetical protein